MKKHFLLLFLSAFVSLSAYSHNFYFSYAEVEYNDFCACFQVSLTFTTHDFETLLREKNLFNKDLETTLKDSLSKSKIEQIINEGFQIQNNGKNVNLKIEGNEHQLNGLTVFYLSSNTAELSKEVIFKFDFLMQIFPEQQNKITFLFRGKKNTSNFYTNHISQLINTEE
jgi:glycosyltransferase involved in cell wall biosynthesis